MRVQREHMAAQQSGRSVLDAADRRVAVLDRSRKLPGLKWRLHPLELAGRHATAEDQRLGAAADSAVQRPYHHILGRGWRETLVSDFSPLRRYDPECAR